MSDKKDNFTDLAFGLDSGINQAEHFNDDSSLNKNLESIVWAPTRYICIYLMRRDNSCLLIYGCKELFCDGFKHALKHDTLHWSAHKKAFEGSHIVYDWTAGKDGSFFYQTALIPLSNKQGDIDAVLALVKTMTSAIYSPGGPLTVADNSPEGLVRIVLESRELEKRKLASVLHDEIGSSAIMINSLLTILKEDVKDGKKTKALDGISKLGENIESSLGRIKKIIATLRPPQIGEMGLNAALKELVANTLKGRSLKASYAFEMKESSRLSETVKITIYRTVQEALNNTIKHAKAKHIRIDLGESGPDITLTITDDGIGFDTKKSRGLSKLGLIGMRENLTYLGGTFNIKSTLGEGTTIKVKCPKISYVRKV